MLSFNKVVVRVLVDPEARRDFATNPKTQLARAGVDPSIVARAPDRLSSDDLNLAALVAIENLRKRGVDLAAIDPRDDSAVTHAARELERVSLESQGMEPDNPINLQLVLVVAPTSIPAVVD